MRLALTSDLHGHLPDVPECDVLAVAGDVCPMADHSLDHQMNWLTRDFKPWLAAAPARLKLLIAGNHDFAFARVPDFAALAGLPCVYLHDSGHSWEGVRFWGSPWATELYNWPFTAAEDELEGHFGRIDPATDVLLVHGPPHGVGDEVIGRRSGDVLHVGSRSLLAAIDRLARLRLVVFGHIHEGAGVYERNQKTLVNASLMNVRYEPVNPVRVVEMDF